MYLDIVDLRDFYAGELGKLARGLLVARLRAMWPDVTGMCVVGLGYVTPYLGSLRDEAGRTLAFMPAVQGVVNWPARGPSSTALVHEAELPLGDGTVDRLILVHCLEASETASELLREAWRVLAPGGRIAIIVPNRRGLWARFEHTPFGYGRPYTRSQLTRLLRETLLSPAGWSEALWVPPFRSRMLLRSATAFERVGSRMRAMPPGVLIVEATKQLYAGIPGQTQRTRLFRPLALPGTAPAPAPRAG